MNIVFNGSEKPTLGVEIECQIVDEAGALATDTAATKILAELDDPAAFKHELLECTIEVITGVCENVGGRPAGSRREGRTADREIRVPRLPGHVYRNAPVLIVGRPDRVAGPSLSPLDRELPVDGAPAPHLRRPHARRGGLGRRGDRDQQQPRHVHPALPRALVVEPVLARTGYGTRVDTFEDLRVAADGRAPVSDGELGSVPAVHAHVDRRRNDPQHPRGVVGHPSAPGLRHARAPHLRRHPDDGRALRDRRAQPVTRRVVGRPLQRRSRSPRLTRHGRSARTSGGPRVTDSTPRSSATKRATSCR